MADEYAGYSNLIAGLEHDFGGRVQLFHTGGGCMAILMEDLRDHPNTEILITDAEDTLSPWDGTSGRFTGYAVGVYPAEGDGHAGDHLSYVVDKNAVASGVAPMVRQALVDAGR